MCLAEARREDPSSGPTVGQAAGGAPGGLSMEQKCRDAERWNATLGQSGQMGHQGGSTPARRRRRLPGDALIKHDVGLGLAEKVPVRHRLGSVVRGGTATGGGDRRRARRLTDMGENALGGSSLGQEGYNAHIRPAARTRERRNPIRVMGISVSGERRVSVSLRPVRSGGEAAGQDALRTLAANAAMKETAPSGPEFSVRTGLTRIAQIACILLPW